MQDEVSKFVESLSDMGMMRRSGAAWGNGAQARRQPRGNRSGRRVLSGAEPDVDRRADSDW